MVNEKTLDKYFQPESPWVRGLFHNDLPGTELDEKTSSALATLTGWKPRDKEGHHRYHNAVVMMNITPDDVMYHYIYNFVRDWGEANDSLKRRLGVRHNAVEWSYDYLGLSRQFQHHVKGSLDIDDIISIAILAELTKQGRRDYARATIERAKASLQEYAYSKDLPQDLRGPTKTNTQVPASSVGQRQMSWQKISPNTAGEVMPRGRSSLESSVTRRVLFPTSQDAGSSSGKKQPASSGSVSSGHKRSQVSREAFKHMTPSSEPPPRADESDVDSGSETYESYMASRKAPTRAKQLARLERAVEKSKPQPEESSISETKHSHTRRSWTAAKEDMFGTTDSPLAYKSSSRAAKTSAKATSNAGSSPQSEPNKPYDVQAQQARWKVRDKATAKPKPGAQGAFVIADTDDEREQEEEEVNQEQIDTASDSTSEDELQRDPDTSKQKGQAAYATLTPRKRSKDSPTAHPPSPPKKNRMVSNLTERSISPLGFPISTRNDNKEIQDDEVQDDEIQDDEVQGDEIQDDEVQDDKIQDDEIQDKQPDETLGTLIRDTDPSVSPPVI